jgi:hypothetical protein
MPTSPANLPHHWPPGCERLLEETSYWLELIVESGLKERRLLADLLDEADQLAAILATSAMTAKRRKK